MELGPLTREERILDLTPAVEAVSRGLARQGRRTFNDVIGVAWITAIQVSDSRPDLSGQDLARAVKAAVRWREIDRLRKTAVDGRSSRKRGEQTFAKETAFFPARLACERAPASIRRFEDRRDATRILNQAALNPEELFVVARMYWEDQTISSVARELGLGHFVVWTLHRDILQKLKTANRGTLRRLRAIAAATRDLTS